MFQFLCIYLTIPKPANPPSQLSRGREKTTLDGEKYVKKRAAIHGTNVALKPGQDLGRR
jgi:hypothetical protein